MSDGAAEHDGTTVAVAAHSLLQSVSVILAAAEMIQTHSDQLSRQRQDELLSLICSQGRHVAGVLVDLVRGVPAEVLAVLEELRPAAPMALSGNGEADLALVPISLDWD